MESLLECEWGKFNNSNLNTSENFCERVVMLNRVSQKFLSYFLFINFLK